MPELPEVETVVRHLRPLLTGRTITGFTAHWHKVTAPGPVASLLDNVRGQTITGASRRAKFILLHLEAGIIHIHLRMTGKLYVAHQGAAAHPHIRAGLSLSDNMELRFRDPRKFGRMGYLPALADLDARLGPEPLGSGFTAESLHAMLQGHKRQIKPLLLDQSFIAGLGNIYVDEALHQARVHPRTLSQRVSRARAEALHGAITGILAAAIKARGTTIIDYAYAEGASGGYAIELKVFGRNGLPCTACGTAIVKKWIGQRGTHYCPRCQRRR